MGASGYARRKIVSTLVVGLCAMGVPVVGDAADDDRVSPVPREMVAQAPAASTGFRYDEASGRCLDADGRLGYNRSSRAELTRTRVAECADFEDGVNLTYLRLEKANLRGAKFAGVPWYLGSITDSDLSGADLSGTSGQMDYRGSRLRGARLSGADLTYAELKHADLRDADLRGATFSVHTTLPFDRDEARRRGMIFVPKP